MLGWPAVERVWLPAWLRDPDAVVAELVARVEAVRTGRDTGDLPDVHVESLPMAKAGPVPSDADSAARWRVPSGTGAALPGAEPFVAWTPEQVRSRHTLDALPSPAAGRRVWDVATQVIDTEGPVLEARLVKLVASAFDLARVSAGRAEAIRACLPTSVRDENGFYWPPTRPRGAWTGFRQPDGEARPLDDVSLEEIGNAMVGLCRAGMGMSREELLKESVAVFGGKRLTPAIRTRVEAALVLAVGRGVLGEDGSGTLLAR